MWMPHTTKIMGGRKNGNLKQKTDELGVKVGMTEVHISVGRHGIRFHLRHDRDYSRVTQTTAWNVLTYQFYFCKPCIHHQKRWLFDTYPVPSPPQKPIVCLMTCGTRTDTYLANHVAASTVEIPKRWTNLVSGEKAGVIKPYACRRRSS